MSIESVNLLPPARRAVLHLRRRVQIWTLAIAGYGMATLGACVTLAAGEPVVDRGETKELTALTREADQFKGEDAVNKQQVVNENARYNANKLVADHPDWSILLDLLATVRGDQAVLETVEVKPADALPGADGRAAKGGEAARGERVSTFDVTLNGFSRTQTGVTDFADRLQGQGVFDSVILERSSARAMGESAVIEFAIKCRIGTTSADGRKARP